MKLTKSKLEALYKTRSLGELAEHLGIARSTLYYHMKKLGVERRTKSDAQLKHLSKSSHQRSGKSHSSEAREKISEGARKFWDSDQGVAQKNKLRTLRRREWNQSSVKKKNEILSRLQDASRPAPGELSRFGEKLAAYLGEHEEVSTGIQLTRGHVSDIILETRKVVVELLLPVSVYGSDPESKTEARYKRLVNELRDLGYRVAVVIDESNSVSRARCQRIYDELLKFFNSNKGSITIQS